MTARQMAFDTQAQSKLTLESGTNPTNRKYTLQTPTTRRDASYKLNVVSEARSGD